MDGDEGVREVEREREAEGGMEGEGGMVAGRVAESLGQR